MAIHSLFPGFIRVTYTTQLTPTVHTHHMTLPVKPVLDVGSGDWHVELKGGGTLLWVTALNDLITTFLPFFNVTNAAFSFADLYTMDDEDADPIWRDGYAIAVAGTSATAGVFAGQTVHTFRTELGGILRLYFMESVVPDDTITPPPYASNLATLVNQMTEDDTGFVVGRDGGFLTSMIRRVSKENDVLRKKYVLNT